MLPLSTDLFSHWSIPLSFFITQKYYSNQIGKTFTLPYCICRFGQIRGQPLESDQQSGGHHRHSQGTPRGQGQTGEANSLKSNSKIV
jgi:hypothetical protein